MLLWKGLAVGIVLLFLVSVIPFFQGEPDDVTDDSFAAQQDSYQYMMDWSVHPTNQTMSEETSGPSYNYVELGNMEPNPLSGPMDSAWPSYSHDNQHTSQSQYNTRDNPMNVKWRFQTDKSGFDSSPVIDKNGTLYIGCMDHYLYAINPDGSERWRFNLNNWPSPSYSAALAEDGTIYIGSLDDYLYAIESDGTLKWRFQAAGSIWGSSMVGTDGTIYFGALNSGENTGRVYAVNPNGSEKWHTDVGDYIYTSPALAKDDTVYISSNDCNLYALYPENGSILWKFHTNDAMGCPSVGIDGTIYGASWDNYLYALYSNGTVKWKTKIDSGSFSTPAIGNDGTIYIGGKFFYAVNPDGTLKWTYQGWEEYEYTCTSSAYAISADGIIYFVVSKDNGYGCDLFALNSDGTLYWRKNIAPNGWVYSPPVIGNNGTVYIGCDWVDDIPTGALFAFGSVENNHPPEKPNIDGPSTGKPREEHTYHFTITDQDSDDVYVFVDWGDRSNSSWIGPYISGEQITLTHTWNLQGTYTLKAKAMDEHEVEGDWATLTVTMPTSYNQSLLKFMELLFQRFPLLEKLFSFIGYNLGMNTC